MRTGLTLAAIVACSVLVVSVAAADPSYFGYTGLIRVPNAQALSLNEFDVAAFHIDREELDYPEVYTGDFGVGHEVEVGLAIIRRDEGTDDIFLNGKYQFQEETGKRPALAAGVIDLAGEVDSTAYFVMTQGIGKPYHTAYGRLYAADLTVGFGGGQLDGLFAGMAANLGPRARLMLEYDSEDWNLGANFNLGSRFLGQVALFDWDDVGFGLSYHQEY